MEEQQENIEKKTQDNAEELENQKQETKVESTNTDTETNTTANTTSAISIEASPIDSLLLLLLAFLITCFISLWWSFKSVLHFVWPTITAVIAVGVIVVIYKTLAKIPTNRGTAIISMLLGAFLGISLANPLEKTVVVNVLSSNPDDKNFIASMVQFGQTDDPVKWVSQLKTPIIPVLMQYINANEAARFPLSPQEVRGDNYPVNNALKALRLMDREQTIAKLAEFTKDPSVRMRMNTVSVLRRLQDKKVIPTIVPLLEDKAFDVVAMTAIALKSLEYPEEDFMQRLDARLPLFIDGLFTLQSEAAKQLICVFWGGSAVKPLCEKLEKQMYVEIIDVLGRIGDSQACPTLIKCLSDEDSNIRSHATLALGFIGDPGTTEVLTKLSTSDPDDNVRKVATKALKYIQVLSPSPKLEISQQQKIAEVTTKIELFLKQLKSYELESEAIVWLKEGEKEQKARHAFINYKGISGKKYLFELVQKDYMGQTNSDVHVFASFDGVNQWLYIGETKYDNNSLVKIDLAQVRFPGRPFDTSTPVVGVSQIGLAQGEDYPQNIANIMRLYSFTDLKPSEDKKYIELSGTLKIDIFKRYCAEVGMIALLLDRRMMLLVLQGCTKIRIKVRSSDGAIVGWTFIVKGSASSRMVFDIKTMKINSELSDAIFTPKKEAGEAAQDITARSVLLYKKRISDRQKALSLLQKPNKQDSKDEQAQEKSDKK